MPSWKITDKITGVDLCIVMSSVAVWSVIYEVLYVPAPVFSVTTLRPQPAEQ